MTEIVSSNMETPTGLTTAEMQERLRRYGPNRVEEERRHPLLAFFSKFWAPVPWMLEATIILEILVHKRDEAVIIGVLLIFNAFLSFVQESQANRALALLRDRLSVQARVLRDGRWQVISAEQLVPGDVLHLRLGDLAPADVRLFEGAVQADESELTGESLPVEKSAGAIIYAGSRLKRGEASGEVTATAQHTYFGKTAGLVKTAKTRSHLQEIIFAIVKYLVIFDSVLVAILLVYAGFSHLPWTEVLPFALILLVASVPVALPATFTVATAIGALDMSRHAAFRNRRGRRNGCSLHRQDRNHYSESASGGGDLSPARATSRRSDTHGRSGIRCGNARPHRFSHFRSSARETRTEGSPAARPICSLRSGQQAVRSHL
jgi:H+-transporting ATPase